MCWFCFLVAIFKWWYRLKMNLHSLVCQFMNKSFGKDKCSYSITVWNLWFLVSLHVYCCNKTLIYELINLFVYFSPHWDDEWLCCSCHIIHQSGINECDHVVRFHFSKLFSPFLLSILFFLRSSFSHSVTLCLCLSVCLSVCLSFSLLVIKIDWLRSWTHVSVTRTHCHRPFEHNDIVRCPFKVFIQI